MSEYSLFYRALLQKRPMILRSLLIVAIPYVVPYCYSLFYRALLQKRPMILRSLLIVAIPYVVPYCYRLFYRALLQKRPYCARHTMGWLRLAGSLKL